MPKSYAQIVLPLRGEKTYTYRIPVSLRDCVKSGCRVLVPMGQRTVTGVVVALSEKSPVSQVKEIVDTLDSRPIFDATMLALTRWIAQYYLCSWDESLKVAMPAELRHKVKKFVHLKEPYADALAQKLRRASPIQADIVRELASRGELSDTAVARRVGRDGLTAALLALQEAGHIEMREVQPGRHVGVRTQQMVRLRLLPQEVSKALSTLGRRAPQQAAALDYLMRLGRAISIRDLSDRSGASSDVIGRLADRGWVEVFPREYPREPYAELSPEAAAQHTLTADQRRVLRQIDGPIREGKFGVFLIHGVTGSGKTEVYIQAIRRTLELGRTAIVLVPEISLTPQTVSRFRAHFGPQVAVFHSNLSAGERYDTWRRMAQGPLRIVVGARSAVFAPLPRVGLIVVDEEHVDSYKQTEAQPRYHARDVAIMRAKLSGAVILLGSATPSLESFENVNRKKYAYCTLPQRVDGLPLPPVQIVDMCQEKREDNWGIFSRTLKEKISQRLDRNEQVILFLNRRGFSTCIKCQQCGFVMACPHCSVTLTYHAHDLMVKCHYCGFRRQAPDICPTCGGPHIHFRGVGTQRVEQEMKELFPRASVLRMDQDTTRRRGAQIRILDRFGGGQADVLLGTQMIAKGLDFPRVTLVGVIMADVGLNVPDFRSVERTFQVITQVAGRAGRSALGGEVLVQTYSPQERAIRLAQNHDYLEFARQELSSRMELGYPPYGRLVLFLLQSTEQMRVESSAHKLGDILRDQLRRQRLPEVQILGPAPAPLVRIRGQYRWQILLKGGRSAVLHQVVRMVMKRSSRWPPWPGVRIGVVVDPVEMM